MIKNFTFTFINNTWVMDNTADFPETQPTLNPHWKEALDKAMHQSLTVSYTHLTLPTTPYV